MRFVERHPDRGTPYTPIAFLLDPAHGWDMTDYPQWPFEVSQINRSDRALRELFGVAYYPGLVVEGEPASGDRQAFVNGVFGDIFDVLVASRVSRSTISPLDAYRAVVVGGQIEWSKLWVQRLTEYVKSGGTIVLNAAQVESLPPELLGVRLTGETARAHTALCLSPGEPAQDLSGQIFSYDRLQLKGALPLITTTSRDPIVTVNRVGKGTVVFAAVPDLLGADERITPFAAHMLAHVFADATPIRVRGDVEYLVNRNETGWVVTLINNNGVFKPQQGLAQVDRRAYVTATINLAGKPIQTATDWTNGQELEIKGGLNGVTVAIAPGDLSIIELRFKK